ncbi:MAG: DUF1801 domain-containing protein [Polyangiaceae bacterium]
MTKKIANVGTLASSATKTSAKTTKGSKGTSTTGATAARKAGRKAASKVVAETSVKMVERANRSAVTTARDEPGESASRLIDQRIHELGGWRGDTLARMRALIQETDPEIVEEWKWRGTPVWSRAGIICTGETYAKVVKLTFAHGASLPDPTRLFNSSLDGNTRRAIDIREGETVDAKAFKALVKAAIALNTAGKKGARR